MTPRIIPLPRDPHRDLQALLPWYAKGGLEPAERETVRAHLSQCAACRAELADEDRFAAALADLPPTADAPDVEHGWAALSRQLDQQAEPAPRRARVQRGGRLAALWPAQAPSAWMGWAMAAQFSAIVVLAAMLLRPPTPAPAQYHTLSSGPADRTANLVVVFQPDTREQDLRGVLRATDARLVDGPTASDAYMLHVAPAKRAQALQMLRRRREVVLAEPIDAS